MQNLVSPNAFSYLGSTFNIENEYNYDFTTNQDNNSITLSFQFNKFKTEKPLVIINKEKSSICITYKNKILLCGTLYSEFNSFKSQINGSNYSIIFYKKTKGKWPYLIGSESSRGLDPKSYITIGNHIEENIFDIHRFDKSLIYFRKHFKPEYIPILKEKAFKLLDSSLQFKVIHGTNILRPFPLNSITEDEIIKLAKVLFKLKRFNYAKNLLTLSMENYDSDAISLLYVKLLSPYKYNQISENEIPLYKQALEILVQRNNLKAIEYLCKHLRDGLYYPKDIAQANQLMNLVNGFKRKKNTKATKVFLPIIAGISVGFAAFALYKIINRDKND